MSRKIEKLMDAKYMCKDLPDSIRIPPIGDIETEVVKPIEEATIDELTFAAQALDNEYNAILDSVVAIRLLCKEARAKGALGCENIIAALSRKGGAR